MKGYVAVLQQNPGSVDALYYVAMLALQQGQFGEGLKVIQRAIDSAPQQARLHNLKGQAHLRQNAGRRRAARLSAAPSRPMPAFADAYGNRGTLLAEMGRAEEALADFDRALALRPDNRRGPLQPRRARWPISAAPTRRWRDFHRAIALMPGMAPAYYNRADVLLRIGRPDEALHDYDRSIALYPEIAVAHAGRGIAMKMLGRLDEALASLDQAIKLDPDLAEAHVNRGHVLEAQGRADEAKASFSRAGEIDPKFAAPASEN